MKRSVKNDSLIRFSFCFQHLFIARVSSSQITHSAWCCKITWLRLRMLLPLVLRVRNVGTVFYCTFLLFVYLQSTVDKRTVYVRHDISVLSARRHHVRLLFTVWSVNKQTNHWSQPSNNPIGFQQSVDDSCRDYLHVWESSDRSLLIVRLLVSS